MIGREQLERAFVVFTAEFSGGQTPDEMMAELGFDVNETLDFVHEISEMSKKVDWHDAIGSHFLTGLVMGAFLERKQAAGEDLTHPEIKNLFLFDQDGGDES